MERAPFYERAMQRMKIQWLRLKLNPPLILGLHEGREKNEDQKEWEEEENNVGFYPPEGTPFELPWDVRETTRALKEIRRED